MEVVSLFYIFSACKGTIFFRDLQIINKINENFVVDNGKFGEGKGKYCYETEKSGEGILEIWRGWKRNNFLFWGVGA